MDGKKERQGDFVFTAQQLGEYRFCFNNEMSTFAEKLVDFEIAVHPLSRPFHEKESRLMKQVENEQRAQLPSRQGTSPEQADALDESIFKLSAQLSTISRNQKYFRTRENRNFSTVRSTERRIFNFSVIEGLMMVSMAGLQVFVVRFFFQGARKGMFSLLTCVVMVVMLTGQDMCDELWVGWIGIYDNGSVYYWYQTTVYRHLQTQLMVSE